MNYGTHPVLSHDAQPRDLRIRQLEVQWPRDVHVVVMKRESAGDSASLEADSFRNSIQQPVLQHGGHLGGEKSPDKFKACRSRMH